MPAEIALVRSNYCEVARNQEGRAAEMKPASFKYVKAQSLDEVFELQAEYDDEAKLLAGGQSLVPLMNMRMAQPSVLVDLNGLTELSGISNGGPVIEIGALTRQIEVERSSVVSALPIVGEALRHVAHAAIRSRGTFGGNLAHADPASELPALLLALEGEFVATGPGGERVIAAEDFFRGYFTTALESTEVLTSVRIPADQPSGWAFVELARRHGDFALAGVAALIDVDASGVCQSARIALFGVSDVPVRAKEAEAFLAGRPTNEDGLLKQAAELATAPLEPSSDIHAPAEYRKKLSKVLVQRALTAALSRGGGA
jgi:carbon-monoxide dehydrogenase medium subunit